MGAPLSLNPRVIGGCYSYSNPYSSSNSFLIALRKDGTLWGIGSNYYGQLGFKSSISRVYEWTQLSITGVKAIFNGGSYYNQSSCSVFALLENGDIYATGYNGNGQLGLSNTSNTYGFTQVGLSNVKFVYPNQYGVLFTRTNGECYYRGRMDFVGGFNSTSTISELKPTNTTIFNIISACESYSGSGMVYVSTDNKYFVTYQNVNANFASATAESEKVYPGTRTDVAHMACGRTSGTVFYLSTDKKLYGFGANTYGVLNTGNSTAQTSWVQVATDVEKFAVGYDHLVILKTNGAVQAIGYNGYGQLCDGTKTSSISFVNCNVPGKVKDVQAFLYSSLFILDDDQIIST